MLGRMMDFPLSLSHLLERARTQFPRGEIVTRRADRSLVRASYADFHRRALQLAAALVRLGIRPGDRVATLCWNHQQHLEAYIAVPCMGAVLHTLNIRLFEADLAYIVEHARDEVVIVDESLLPLWEKVAARVTCVKATIVPTCDHRCAAVSSFISPSTRR